jgi:hypothetical protein
MKRRGAEVPISTSSKKHQPPLQSRGTWPRAFFAVRKQHTVQVKPVEGAAPGPLFVLFFCGYAAKKQNKQLFFGGL